MIAAALLPVSLFLFQAGPRPGNVVPDLADETSFRQRLFEALGAVAAGERMEEGALFEDVLARAGAVAEASARPTAWRILAHALGLSPEEAEAVLRGNERLQSGTVSLREGSLSCARVAFTDALLSFREAQDPYHCGRAERFLGTLALLEGNPGLAAAHYEEAAALARVIETESSEAAALEGLAFARARSGLDWRTPLARCEALEGESGDPREMEKRRLHLARALIAHRETTEAVRLLLELLDPVEAASESGGIRPEILALLGQAALENLDFERARVLLREARTGLGDPAPGADTLQAEIEMGLAQVAIWRGDLGEAERCASRAVRLADRFSTVAEDARLVWVRALCLQRKPAEALAVARGRRRAESDSSDRQRAWLLNEGIVLHQFRRDEEAADFLERALAHPPSESRDRTEIAAHAELAAIRLQQGNPRAAEEHARAAIALAESRLAQAPPGPPLDYALHRWPYRAFEIGVAAVLAQGRPEEAFDLAERSKARGFLVELGRYGPGAFGEGPEPGTEDWRDAVARLREIGSALEASVSPLEVERIRLEYERAGEDLASAARRARVAAPDRFVEPSPASAAAVRARLLGDDRVFLEYFLGEERALVFVIERDSAQAIEIGRPREVALAAHTLAGALRGSALSARMRETLEASARRVTDLLLPGGLAARLVGREVYVVPDGPIFGLPFEALLSPEGGFLGETTTFAYGFSAGLLLRMAGRSVRLENGILVAAGPGGDPGERLRHARAEAIAARKHFPEEGSTVLLGAEFTKKALFADRDPIGVLHFVTHTEESGNRVGLRVSGQGADGVLWAEDAIRIGGSPDLVVLSGCGTARGGYVRGLGLRGLLYPFFFAGASRVVASLWPVEDESVPSLMDEFYRSLRESGSVPTALSRARQPYAPGARRENLPLYFAFLSYGPF